MRIFSRNTALHAGGGTPWPYRRISVIGLLAGMVLGLACAGLIPLPVPPAGRLNDPDAWLMLGKNEAHHHSVRRNVPPPIALVWKQRLNSVIPDHPLAFEGNIIAPLRNGNLTILSLERREMLAMDRIGPAMAHTPSIHLPFLYAGFNLGNHTLMALNLRNAEQEYRRRYGEVLTAPIYWERKLYFGTRTKRMYCVNAGSGDSVWSFPARAAIHASPAVRNPLVVFADIKGYVYGLDVSSGIPFWERRLNGAVFSHPVLDDSTVYVGTVMGTLYALDQRTGAVRWERQLGGSLYSSPSLFQKYLYIGSNGNEVVALRKTEGTVVWRFSTQGIVNTVPLSSPDYVYVGSWDANLYILNRYTGKLVFKQTLNGAIKSSPIIYRNYLIVHSANKHLWIFVTEKLAREMQDL